VAPDEEDEIRRIERAVGKRLPRVTLPDFDYKSRPDQPLEIPQAQRIAAIRAKKSEDRARAKAKADRRAPQGGSSGGSKAGPGGSSHGGQGGSPRPGGHRSSDPRKRSTHHRRGPGGPRPGGSGS